MNFSNNVDLKWFKNCLQNETLIKKLLLIKLIICDVDGALTDASVYVSQEKEEGRCFSVHDGFIMKYILTNNIKVAWVSGKDNLSAQIRSTHLHIPDNLCLTGVKDKALVIQSLQNNMQISKEQTLIFGDDFIDAHTKIKNVVAIFACPSNSPFYIQEIADIVIPKHGGNGAFRLLGDLLLFIHKKHFVQNVIEDIMIGH